MKNKMVNNIIQKISKYFKKYSPKKEGNSEIAGKKSNLDADFIENKADGLDNSAQQLDNLDNLNNGNNGNNLKIRFKQNMLIILILLGGLGLVGFLSLIVNSKVSSKNELEEDIGGDVKIELADKALDTDGHWRNHYEDKMKQDKEELMSQIKDLQEEMQEVLKKTKEEVSLELGLAKNQLSVAKGELLRANNEIEESARAEEERQAGLVDAEFAPIDEIDYGREVELDVPKPASEYVPEGTYFTGYLLGGIVVSTALSTPDENATPVSIRLTNRGNLDHENQLDIAKCRMMGSAYGDLSSERAVIRLEKLICKQAGSYITSDIAGIVYGPDGLNGLKGEIIATSVSHLKNAFLGGIISGLSGAAGGQEGFSIAGSGLVSKEKKGFKDLAISGVQSGTSNAGEKIADYYLKRAESMSPVLTIAGGVRLQAHITKGFFLGQVGLRKRINNERRK